MPVSPDAQALLDVLNRQQRAAVLRDLDMPGMDGGRRSDGVTLADEVRSFRRTLEAAAPLRELMGSGAADEARHGLALRDSSER
jgi:hypothetical protein